MPRTAVVTDSTASLPEELAAEHGVTVVPLQVVVDSTPYEEGTQGATPAGVADAMREATPVSTSRPAPALMLEVYERLAAEGATEIVSVHLSAEMSGTFESAQLAAREAPVPVVPVDSRQVGIATGFSVITAAEVVAAGGDAEAAATAARRRAVATTSLFYVDTLEHLRRGGRVGGVAALLGGALAVKPLLAIEDGRVVDREKVRTSARALARLEELAVAAAGDEPIDVGVAHLASEERGAALAQRLGERLAANLADRAVHCGEVSAVLGAHVGPGMLAVCVAPRRGWGDAG